ncbi:MAG: hypothetical protein KAT65_11440 [Methanophagales archaeon]|nr:hypothetical protein [Methanophagales archaeon]
MVGSVGEIDTKTETMSEFYIQYYTRTRLNISDWKEWEQTPLPAHRFDFRDATVAMRDCVRQEGADKFHVGLEFIVQTHATNEEEAKEKSKIFVEIISNLISFSTLSFCDAANINNVIEIKRGVNLSPSQFYIYPFKDDFIIGSSVKIDEAVFGEIWNKYNKSGHQQSSMRAMSWFRKGLNETGLDEFISYWIGVEILKGILKSDVDARVKEELDKCIIPIESIKKISLSTNAIITKEKDSEWIISDGEKVHIVREKGGRLNIYTEDKQGCRKRITDDWIGVKMVFEDKVQYSKFSEIKEIRNGILHGYKELSNDFVKEAKRYIPSLRKGLIACISSVLSTSDEVFNKIINKDVRKVKLELWKVIKGDFENLPSTFDGMIINYPKIEAKIKDKKISREQDGKLNIIYKFEYKFLCDAPNAQFKMNETEVWGDKHSGIENVQLRINED